MVTAKTLKENPMAAIIDLNETIMSCDDIIKRCGTQIEEAKKVKEDAETMKAQIMFLGAIGAL